MCARACVCVCVRARARASQPAQHGGVVAGEEGHGLPVPARAARPAHPMDVAHLATAHPRSDFPVPQFILRELVDSLGRYKRSRLRLVAGVAGGTRHEGTGPPRSGTGYPRTRVTPRACNPLVPPLAGNNPRNPRYGGARVPPARGSGARGPVRGYTSNPPYGGAGQPPHGGVPPGTPVLVGPRVPPQWCRE